MFQKTSERLEPSSTWIWLQSIVPSILALPKHYNQRNQLESEDISSSFSVLRNFPDGLNRSFPGANPQSNSPMGYIPPYTSSAFDSPPLPLNFSHLALSKSSYPPYLGPSSCAPFSWEQNYWTHSRPDSNNLITSPFSFRDFGVYEFVSPIESLLSSVYPLPLFWHLTIIEIYLFAILVWQIYLVSLHYFLRNIYCTNSSIFLFVMLALTL